MKVRVSRPAEADLTAIFDYIYSDSPRAAEAVLNALLDAIAGLSRFPLRGRTGRLPETREYVVKRTGHVVIYAVLPGEVVVLRVRHGRQKPLD